MSVKSEYDPQEIYCRKLGHHLKFNYCHNEQISQPCSRIVECWNHLLPIQEILNKSYPDLHENTIDQNPMPKITSILDIVQKVKSQIPNS